MPEGPSGSTEEPRETPRPEPPGKTWLQRYKAAFNQWHRCEPHALEAFLKEIHRQIRDLKQRRQEAAANDWSAREEKIEKELGARSAQARALRTLLQYWMTWGEAPASPTEEQAEEGLTAYDLFQRKNIRELWPEQKISGAEGQTVAETRLLKLWEIVFERENSEDLDVLHTLGQEVDEKRNTVERSLRRGLKEAGLKMPDNPREAGSWKPILSRYWATYLPLGEELTLGEMLGFRGDPDHQEENRT